MEHQYFVYILSNKNNNVLYVGVTSNLSKRIYEHKNGLLEGFTKKYNVEKLVYFECTSNIVSAIEREKQLKHWGKDKKRFLINRDNPNWVDLSLEW